MNLRFDYQSETVEHYLTELGKGKNRILKEKKRWKRWSVNNCSSNRINYSYSGNSKSNYSSNNNSKKKFI